MYRACERHTTPLPRLTGLTPRPPLPTSSEVVPKQRHGRPHAAFACMPDIVRPAALAKGLQRGVPQGVPEEDLSRDDDGDLQQGHCHAEHDLRDGDDGQEIVVQHAPLRLAGAANLGVLQAVRSSRRHPGVGDPEVEEVPITGAFIHQAVTGAGSRQAGQLARAAHDARGDEVGDLRLEHLHALALGVDPLRELRVPPLKEQDLAADQEAAQGVAEAEREDERQGQPDDAEVAAREPPRQSRNVPRHGVGHRAGPEGAVGQGHEHQR
mmetsp:Transcript_79482/g.246845  ORF Transcript_79482/g.246845 Transcript_79482/m.246845 type:complete len:267 (-) Transcript_79482:393-1193(-)